jgi:L-ribulokinase
VVLPRQEATAVYEELFLLYRKAYFALGTRSAEAVPLGDILPELRRIASKVAGHR